MLVHFFLQSLVLFAVLAIVRWHVAWAYVPLLPARAGRSCCCVTGALGILLSRDQRVPARHAALPRARAARVVLGDADRVRVHDRRPAARRLVHVRCCMPNPVTPIVLIFQRAIYAKLDNPSTRSRSTGTSCLPHWSYWRLPRVPRLLVRRSALIVLAIAIRVFGRSEANFAEELCVARRDRGPQRLQAVPAVPRALHVAEGDG